MRKNPDPQRAANEVNQASVRGPAETIGRRFGLVLLGVFAFLALSQMSVLAQKISANPVRVTVPAYAVGTVTNIVLDLDPIGTNATLNLTVDISGATGVTSATLDSYSFTETTGTNVLNTNAVLTVHYDGTVPQTGTNEVAIIANGDYVTRLPLPFKSAVFWSGDTNNTVYETAANWEGNAVPTAGDVAFFGTTMIGTNTAAPGDSGTNVVVSADTPALAGLRFAQQADTYDVEIKTNVTVWVTGTEGFQMLGDGFGDDSPVTLFGGGNLVVSNSTAPFGLFSTSDTLDMAGLGTVVADVNRVCLNNFSCYPNLYTNGLYSPNGYYSAGADVYLARSNYFKTAWIGGDAVITNTGEAYFPRPYAFSFSVPSRVSPTPLLALGVTNVIYSESILLCAGGNNFSVDKIYFSTDTNVIPTNVVPALYVRGEDETNRCAVLTIGDNSGPYLENQNSKARANLTGGKVDALIDKLFIGRDRWQCGDNDGMDAELQIGGPNAAGTIVDVNTAYVSMQEQGNNHISSEILEGDDPPADPQGSVRSILRVGSNAVFRVNETLHLGYTTAEADDIRKAYQGYGAVFINGGTVMVNEVLVGGVTKLSGNDQRFNHLPEEQQNGFTLTGGGELVITNQAGQAGGDTNRLNGLNMTDSTLTLHVNGNQTDAYVYTDELNTGGAGNLIRIASVTNIGAYPAQVALISYNSASPNFSVELPENFYGFILNNEADQTIDVVILDTPPQSLVWDSGTWDTNSSSWKEGKIFADGDSPTFDDTATSSSVSVPGTVFVGGSGVLVSNQSKAYTFNGAGRIGGTAPMSKWGANALTLGIDSTLPLNIHEGDVTVSLDVSVGATTVSSNTSLMVFGTLVSLTSDGTATLSTGSSVLNGATIEKGTTSNSGTVNGRVGVGANALLTVNPDGVVNNSAPHTSNIDEGGSVVLNGVWENGHPLDPEGEYRINIFGTLTGTGSVEGVSWQDQAIPDLQSRLNIGAGGVFSPGSAPGDIITFTNLGRFDFQTGARVVLDLDMDSADGSSPWSAFTPNAGNNTGAVIQQKAKTSDTIWADRWSTMTGTLVLNNVGLTPFTNGAVFKLFKKELDAFAEYPGNFGNRPDNDDQLPRIEPALPGLGLRWDLSHFRTNGLLSVVGGGPTEPPMVDFVITNDMMVLFWPSNYVGWQVYAQTNELDVGLTANWFPVPDTTDGTNFTVDIISSNPAVFYQLGLPAVPVP